MDRRAFLLGGAASLLARTAAAQGQRGQFGGPPGGQRPRGGPAPMPPDVPQGERILDVHAHLFGRTSGDFAGAAEAAVHAMDRLGIVTTVVMPTPQPPNFEHQYEFDALLSALSHHAGRFRFLGGGGTLNPMIHRHAQAGVVTDGVRREFAAAASRILDAGAAGFGEICAEHLSYSSHHPYESTPPDGPLMLELADLAAARGVPIDFHMDAAREDRPTPEALATYATKNPKTVPANIARFERLLAHNRGARIVWAHAGRDPIGDWTTALSRELLERHPNLYMSISLTPPMLNAPIMPGMGLKPDWRALLEEFPDRFMIGTDHFYGPPLLGGRQLERAGRPPGPAPAPRFFVNALPLNFAAKIARENAAALYKIPV